MARLQKEAAPLAKAEEGASKAMSAVDKSMAELTVKLNETNRTANDIVKRSERETNRLEEIKVSSVWLNEGKLVSVRGIY